MPSWRNLNNGDEVTYPTGTPEAARLDRLANWERTSPVQPEPERRPRPTRPRTPRHHAK